MVGNVVEDLAPDGRWVPGGPSLYAARSALALGARVTLATRLTPDYDRSALAGLDVLAIPASRVPRYVNTYAANGARTQRLLAEGEPLPEELPPGPTFDVVLAAPAYRELAGLPAERARLTGVTLQGALRTVDDEQRVSPRRDPWTGARAFVRPGVFAFLSVEDTRRPLALARRVARVGASCFVTRGARGADCLGPGCEHHIAAIPARQVEPTGAGDCFAAAFLLHFAEHGDTRAAGRFAAAAGALAVEGTGMGALPTRSQVEARLARAAA